MGSRRHEQRWSRRNRNISDEFVGLVAALVITAQRWRAGIFEEDFVSGSYSGQFRSNRFSRWLSWACHSLQFFMLGHGNGQYLEKGYTCLFLRHAGQLGSGRRTLRLLTPLTTLFFSFPFLFVFSFCLFNPTIYVYTYLPT